jgi:hypothetical protein
MTTYKDQLKAIIGSVPITDMTNPRWNELNDLITQDVLKDAYETGVALSKSTSIAGRNLVPRLMKTMERINVKKAMTDRPDLGFKTNCDLMAFRVFIKNVQEIPLFVNEFDRYNKQIGNIVLIRNSILDQTTGLLNDIVQYVYVYHTNEGYLAEYQIGHPFAALKFKHDSMIRDKSTEPGVMDFKKSSVKVYRLVVEQLLKPQDNFDFVQLWTTGFGAPPSQEWIDTMS